METGAVDEDKGEMKGRNDEFCEQRRTGVHLAEGADKDTGYVRATVLPARFASSNHVFLLATM